MLENVEMIVTFISYGPSEDAIESNQLINCLVCPLMELNSLDLFGASRCNFFNARKPVYF